MYSTGYKAEYKNRGSITYSTETKKTSLVRYLLYLWVQIEKKDFNSNKLLNLHAAGHTVKYSSLYWPIILYALTESYNKPYGCSSLHKRWLRFQNFHQIREFCNLYSLQHDFECNLVLISTNKFFKDKKIAGANFSSWNLKKNYVIILVKTMYMKKHLRKPRQTEILKGCEH